MNKLLIFLALLIHVFSVAFAQSNKDYLNCKNYLDKEREIFLKNKVRTIIQIRTSYYDYEKKTSVSCSDTTSILKYDLSGNEIENEYRLDDTTFYKREKLKYDAYGRLIYRKFIPSTNLNSFASERHYFYVNKQSCVMKYSLSYDPFQKGKLKDSIAYTYLQDTLISTIYQLDNESEELIYTKTEKKIVDQKTGLIKKDVNFEITKEYQFSEDFKLLSIVTRAGIMKPTRLTFTYEGDLITESNFYHIENSDFLQSTNKYYYEFY
ncbi:hypothetical protein [Fluviicola sp.]|uniref:hypothetical protein n=1 Tax=Fluviicola sp. TaxID=1917219 RepID=UPI0031E3761C